MGVDLRCGDCLEVMPTLEENSVDSIITDPPYGLSFMGKDWDHGVPGVPFWEEALRVAKPGAALLAFGGTRTHHRLMCAIEDAGWEIRDCLMWLYGSGFPKSHDISKAIDKIRDWSKVERLGKEITRARSEAGLSLRETGEAMLRSTDGQYGKWYHRGGHMFFETGRSLPSRPEWECLRRVLPIRAEFQNTYDEAEREVIGKSDELFGRKSGIGNAVNGHYTVGGTKAEPYDITAPSTPPAQLWDGWGTALKPAYEPIILAMKPRDGTFANNALEHGVAGIWVDGCRVASQNFEPKDRVGASKIMSDRPWNLRQQGEGRPRIVEGNSLGRWPANLILDEHAAAMLDEQSGERGPSFGRRQVKGRSGGIMGNEGTDRDYIGGYADTGGASRFFYCAKASRKERNYGLEDRPKKYLATMGDGIGAREHNPDEPGAWTQNNHPTVKPLALMRWLCRLTKTPTEGVVLDPFLGSGPTGIAAVLEGRDFIGIEIERESFEIAEARIAKAQSEVVQAEMAI